MVVLRYHGVWILRAAFAILALSCTRKPVPAGNPIVAHVANEDFGWAGDLDKVFGDTVGTLVVYDTSTHRYLRHNPQRAKARFSPCSTFKIPNTLIGLESGTAANSDHEIRWDETKYPKQPWWDTVLKPLGLDWARSHTLRSAFRESVVWYYKELARAIGPERMQTQLERMDYGNRDVAGGIDQFWLMSSLRISADEQVAFLTRLYERKLGLSERTSELAESIFEIERGEGYQLSAKTGTGVGTDEPGVAWYVGSVKRDGKQYHFALNVAGSTLAELARDRDRIGRGVLVELGLIPTDAIR